MIVTGAYLMNDFFKSLSHEAMTVAFILLQSLVFFYITASFHDNLAPEWLNHSGF